MNKTFLPNGNNKISLPIDLGKAIKVKRQKDGLTQMDAAALCGVGTRFLSELENGKPSVELGKVLQVLKGLGLECLIVERGWHHT